MARLTAIVMIICCLMTSCTSSQNRVGLTIACAASAQFAVRDLAESYAAGTDVKIDVITGSSGRLTTQIINGAPYDIFFSANMEYPELLFQNGLTAAKPVAFGFGIPVIWTMSEDDENLTLKLISSRVRKIAIADPRNAPYGIKAEQFLKDKKIYDIIKNKLVFGENIAQVNEYVINGTVDLGISAKSIVYSPKLKGKGKFSELNNEYWIQQGIVVVKNDRDTKVKDDFLQFVLSEKGKGILKKYGFAF